MADAKVSTFATKAANTCTFTYAYVAANGAYGKVAINASGGLPVYTMTALTPYADNTNSIGTSALRWVNVNLTLAGAIGWNNGSGSSNVLSYVDAVGPAFTDRTTGIPLRFDVQSLTSLRAVTFPDASGTVTLRGNTVTGSGSIVLAADPHLTGVPTAPTAASTDNSTQLATTAFVVSLISPYAPTITDMTGGVSVALGIPPGVLTNFIYTSAVPVATWELTTIDDGTIPGQLVYLSFQAAVAAVTWTATNVDASGFALPSAFTAGQVIGLSWDDGNSVWVRFQ